jgi:mono/diheme cytochrome c family protein
MNTTILLCSLSLALTAAAQGADIQAGSRLAQLRCAACHIVATNAANRMGEIAEAPPFETLSRRFASYPDMLVLNLMGPHSKMNFRLTRTDAEDVAAYIATLTK